MYLSSSAISHMANQGPHAVFGFLHRRVVVAGHLQSRSWSVSPDVYATHLEDDRFREFVKLSKVVRPLSQFRMCWRGRSLRERSSVESMPRHISLLMPETFITREKHYLV